MIEAEELSKRYEDGLLALDRLDLTVEEGEVFILLGANGAGKTTTVNLFLNFIEPSGGSARIRGIDVAEDPLRAKEHVAFVPENVVLYPTLTARQNLDFFTRLGGRKGLSRRDGYELFEEVGLAEEFYERRIGLFSKGMRQKLAIAAALAGDSAAVFLDEPTSGLDPQAAAEFLELLGRLREKGCAIFMASHDIFRARQVADRVGIMKKGKLIAVLDRDELARQDLEALYLDYMRGS